VLWQLNIKNLAIIDDISIEFTKGLNVLTGETGAGKSIILDAMNLILGARADKELIRNGASQAVVEAVFDAGDITLDGELLEEFPPEDGVYTVSRVIYANSKSISRINSVSVTLSQLKAVARAFMDIHGQHQHQSILDEATHMGYLDAFDGKIGEILNAVGEAYAKWREVCAKIARYEKAGRDYEETRDYLTYRIKEISSAGVSEEEEAALLEEKTILKNAQRITSALNMAAEALSYSQDRSKSAMDVLSRVKSDMEDLEGISQRYAEVAQKAANVYYEAQDLLDMIDSEASLVEYDESRLEEIDDRLQLITSLKRKYGPTVKDVLNTLARLEKELFELEEINSDSEALVKEEARRWGELSALCEELTQMRLKAAVRLKEVLEGELKSLSMGKTVFEARVTPASEENKKKNTTARGWDTVEFFISPNPGEPLRPLSKIISGGEAARVMLSIKSALAHADKIPTMIFDEIDSGVSGNVAQAVGKKMAQLGHGHQVICVTHQAQIASCADTHFYVAKEQGVDKTRTRVTLMEGEDRVYALASLVSGSGVNQTALEHARSLLNENRA